MSSQLPKSKINENLSRRDLLLGATSGVAASLAGATLPAWGQAPQPAAAIDHAAPKLSIFPSTMPKAWSAEEFRRRWQAVRQGMKENHFDCLIVPQHSTQAMIHDRQDGDADVQYLVGIPAGWVVVPAEGKITAISNRVGSLLAEKRPIPGLVMTTMFADNAPDIEVRFSDEEGLWSPAIIDCLKEQKMDQARIGVGSLANLFRNAEGSVTYTTFDRVRKAFPQAQFESAADILWRVKLVHSAEEIAVLKRPPKSARRACKP